MHTHNCNRSFSARAHMFASTALTNTIARCIIQYARHSFIYQARGRPGPFELNVCCDGMCVRVRRWTVNTQQIAHQFDGGIFSVAARIEKHHRQTAHRTSNSGKFRPGQPVTERATTPVVIRACRTHLNVIVRLVECAPIAPNCTGNRVCS